MRQKVAITWELLRDMCVEGNTMHGVDHTARCTKGLSEQANIIDVEVDRGRGWIYLVLDDPQATGNDEMALPVWRYIKDEVAQ